MMGYIFAFQQAHKAVVARYADNPWITANPTEFAQAIHLEMRRIDAEAVAANHVPARSAAFSRAGGPTG
jgi:hypothetical protein